MHLGVMIVADELVQASNIYEKLTIEVRGRAAFIYAAGALPIRVWPDFYTMARRIDESLAERAG